MITLAAPWFLVAGALLALVPLALHMLARTPPERRPLPTARFLTPDRRMRIRLRRPTDLVLLALRMGFLILLGAGFAGPEWLPERTGGGVVVVLDAGEDMGPVWDEAVAVARDRLSGGGALVVFDTAARSLNDPLAGLDSLALAGPSGGRSDYLAALRGLREAAVALPAESASAVLITRPRWGAWSPAISMAREAAWEGRIEVVALGGTSAPPTEPTSAEDAGSAGRAEAGSRAEAGGRPEGSGAIVGAADHPLRPYATAAVEALGYESGPAATADLVLLLPGEDGPVEDPDRVASSDIPGAAQVVVLGGGADAAGVAVPWRDRGEEPEPRRSRGRLVLPGGSLDGWLPGDGEIVEGATVVAVWEDGRPAAAAVPREEGCVAYLAAEPARPAAAADPAFPRLVRAMAGACDSARAGNPVLAGDEALAGVPLDAGALAVLRGDGLPAMVDLLSMDSPRGRPLGRLLLALGLLLALIETALAYGRRGTGAPQGPGAPR